jgi:hypothetical protein
MQNSCCAPVQQRKGCEGARTTAMSYSVREKKVRQNGSSMFCCFRREKGAGNAIIKSCVFFSLHESIMQQRKYGSIRVREKRVMQQRYSCYG